MQTPQQFAQPYADDEISLVELWQILVRRKVLFLACFTACLAGGAAFAYLKSPVFEADVVLRIGQVKSASEGPAVLLDSAEELATRLVAQYGENIAEGIKRDRPFITRASVQKGITTTLQLTAEGDTPEDATRLLNSVVSDVHKAHTLMYEDNIRPITERLKRLDEQRQALQQQYADITELVAKLKERDSVQASLVMIERGPITTSINDQDAERLRLSQQLTPPQTRPTELLGEITAPAEPSKPKKPLVFTLAAVLGLLGGVMLAFIAEFVAKAKGRGTPDATSTAVRT